ncbi:MAG: protein kinase domain-containing protein [Fibrobacterota bacterium]
MDRSNPQDFSHRNTPARVGSCLIDSLVAKADDEVVYSVKGQKRIVRLFLKRSRGEVLSVNVETLLKLSHPNLARVFSVGLHKGCPYVEMEKINGTSLEKVFEQRGALPLEVCTAVGIIICRVLDYLHHFKPVGGKHGIMQMNVCPSKIVLCDSEGLKLLGTGENVITDVGNSEKVKESVQYTAPEVLFGKKGDCRSDIYSLGCVLYQMICGEKPFPQSSFSKLLKARRHNRFIPISRYRLKLPRELKRLVKMCLEDKPSNRPEVSAVLGKLEKVHDSLSRHSPQDVIDYLLNATQGRIVVGRKVPKAVPLGAALGVVVLLLIWKTEPEAFIEKSLSLRNMLTGFLNPLETKLSFEDSTSDSSESASVSEEKNGDPEIHRSEADSGGETEQTGRREDDGSDQKRTQAEGQQAPDNETLPSDTLLSEENDTVLARSEEEMGDSGGVIFRFESFSERLRRLYRKNDLLEVFKTEIVQGNFEKSLAVYDLLSDRHKQDTEVRLLRMRALVVLRRKNELEAFFSREPEINDKEYYFAKGQFFYEKKQYETVLKLMEKSRSAVSRFSDSRELDKRAAFYTASCLTIFYKQNPVEKFRNQALNSWFDVKYLYRNDRSHQNFIRAQEEIRRLSNIKTD